MEHLRERLEQVKNTFDDYIIDTTSLLKDLESFLNEIAQIGDDDDKLRIALDKLEELPLPQYPEYHNDIENLLWKIEEHLYDMANVNLFGTE